LRATEPAAGLETRQRQRGRFTRTSLFVISGSAATTASIDTRMVRSSVLMKAEKVAAIVGYENPVHLGCERQNFVGRHGGIRPFRHPQMS
jgi:hypothetical protein